MKTKDDYFDEYGLMHPWGENGILFTSEYITLSSPEYVNKELYDHGVTAIHSQIDKEGAWQSLDLNQKWSHDNHTGVVCLSKRMNMHYHWGLPLKGTNGRVMRHPRDLIFYAWATGRWYSYIAWFFLWIATVAMIVSCATDYKYRNGNQILKTDGKLLTWLRLKNFNMPITAFLCNLAIKHNKEFGSWKKCFEIYFGEDHLMCSFPKERYEV